MRDKYGVSNDSYCYPNSDILKNKLNITKATDLGEAELAFTATRYKEYSSKITTIKDFSLNHLKHLHWQLFQDIYDWAGQIRVVDIAKGDTRFCTCSRIEAESQKQFTRIQALENIISQDELLSEITDIFCELNIIHPFREGNGRVQRFFFEELFFHLGMNVNWPNISKEQWIEANVNGYLGDIRELNKIFNDAIL
ncbi:Fic/DOC family protein [Pseudoalteromonas ostreae]|uniref:Fic/DOC family protein n=1 Tax=Pseudoalteromonas ostreae TaxID=2774154 RepID=UPI001B38E71D|nr:Fic family protein [Pseudoalteromonas ostreae]